ncbi:MAG: Coenzyme F420 hydrogenase/dehydrogenase, beta subunit C-terminal domain [Erysipelotrichaceae bacterium]|nr:Coenzyme F420 hydrogenase/dehydrogenase, beta subunit C-terminal domain [Erysipelotrichaceae bacterium]
MGDNRVNSLTIEKIAHDQCTGCFACFNVCPQNAITMNLDNEGFIFPSIDHSKCINCTACYYCCPASCINSIKSFKKVLRGYSNDPTIRNNGSSGGIFGLLSKRIIEEGGVVWGAVFFPDTLNVRHANSDDVSLNRILKSKYVQSEIRDAYKKVKEELIVDRKVLFCGTPCQIHGLKLYLKHDYNNLTTIDFICHGVPSERVFQEMLENIAKSNNCTVREISFREKTRGWRTQTINIYLASGELISCLSVKNPYYMLFLKNYTLRSSCYACNYYQNHQADITLADDWLIPANLDDDLGTSLVFCNTSDGQQLIEKVASNVRILELKRNEINIERYKHNYDINKRNAFFADFKEKGYAYTVEKYFESIESDISPSEKQLSNYEILKKLAKSFLKRIAK